MTHHMWVYTYRGHATDATLTQNLKFSSARYVKSNVASVLFLLSKRHASNGCTLNGRKYTPSGVVIGRR
jgi:hypothetical protein